MEGIEILLTTENAAFEGSPATEIARILRKLADRFEQGDPPSRLLDLNGNTCGTVKVRTLQRS